jgi:uncharacterized protein (DUF488 family)
MRSPTFADIGRKTLNLDSASVKFTDTAKAVVVAHLAGYPAEMEAFMKLADRHGLYIVENAAPNIEDLGRLREPRLGVQLLCREPEARTAHRRLVNSRSGIMST